MRILSMVCAVLAPDWGTPSPSLSPFPPLPSEQDQDKGYSPAKDLGPEAEKGPGTRDWDIPPCGHTERQTPVKTLAFPRTTYAGGKNARAYGGLRQTLDPGRYWLVPPTTPLCSVDAKGPFTLDDNDAFFSIFFLSGMKRKKWVAWSPIIPCTLDDKKIMSLSSSVKRAQQIRHLKTYCLPK